MSSGSKGAPLGSASAPQQPPEPAAPAALISQPLHRDGAAEPATSAPVLAAGPQIRYMTYYTQRFQGEDGNRVLYFLQDDSKATTTLAVAGHDPRGTGHFTYISTPEMQGVAPALKCTNRAGVMAWLESVGVVAGAPADGAKVPSIDVSKLPSSAHGGPRKPGKRRAADGGTDGPAKRRAKAGHDEGGVSYEVIEAFKQYPELFSWITQQPDEALVKAFAKYREDLQSPVSDEVPDSLGVKEDGTPTGWITTATAIRILDDIGRCEQVSLRLLQVTEIGAAVARLRTHVSPEVSGRAEKITARWRAAADATMQRAKEYMQNNGIR